MKNNLPNLDDDEILPMSDGLFVTGAEFKSIWLLVDFQINPTNTFYPRNGTFRGQADWNYGNPIISLNLNILEGFNTEAGLYYLILHEIGHLVQAGRTVNANLGQGGYQEWERIYIEQYANTIGWALAQALGLPYLTAPPHGFLPTLPEFAQPTGGGGSGGGDSGVGGGGGSGGNGDYQP